MDWLSEYVSWCKSLANNCTEIIAATTDYNDLANAVGGSEARCFIDSDENLWITTPYPQSCMKSRIDAAVKEYNAIHGLRVIEEVDNSIYTRNFGALCFSFWCKVPISD